MNLAAPAARSADGGVHAIVPVPGLHVYEHVDSGLGGNRVAVVELRRRFPDREWQSRWSHVCCGRHLHGEADGDRCERPGRHRVEEHYRDRAPVPPTAGLTVSCSGLSCNFADASSQGSGAISSRSWTFGDATPAVQATSGTHTFATGGTYAITVTVTDVNGLSSSASKTVTVAAPSNVGRMSATAASRRSGRARAGATNYWSATVTVAVHGIDERPIAGAADHRRVDRRGREDVDVRDRLRPASAC